MVRRLLLPAVWSIVLFPCLPLVCGPAALAAEAAAPSKKADLGARLEPYLAILSGKETRFRVRIEASLKIEGHAQEITAEAARSGADSFFLEIQHPEYPLRIERTADRTLLALPAHKTAFEGAGAVSGEDTLRLEGILGRLVSQATTVSPYLMVLGSGSGSAAAALLAALAGLQSEDGEVWTSKSLKDARIVFGRSPDSVEVTAAGSRVRLVKLEAPAGEPKAAAPEGFAASTLDRAELERLLARSARRALEILAPSGVLTHPAHEERTVPNGELRWVEDQRLVILRGGPKEIGRAHGLLLTEETRRCADSVVYVVGAAQTVRTGRWFMDDLRGAWKRLESHIPEDLKEEGDALAEAAGLGREEARLASIFPELFHCSGFAVFGKATADGKLFHGRVLDYMTAIGLQDSAVLFVVAKTGKIPFANVGYAGFTGSVSGMNLKQVSLGEMGGRGEGKWDGVPMSVLMRRALEECDSLESVKKLWRDSPRTCEYYFVFADGKIPAAVGVAATPEKVEFIEAGQGHPLLGDGIPDAVVLSAGDRLRTLRQRVKDGHGKIGVQEAIHLMDRPVAMRSNLHNALFVPQDLELWVANADRKSCAAERPYVRFRLKEILEPAPVPATAGVR